MSVGLRAWLDQFVAAVRGNDLEAGRALFADDVVGYGALTSRMVGLDDLVRHQWTPTWQHVTDWQVGTLDVATAAGGLGVLAFTWARVHPDGRRAQGRATLALRQDQDGRWRCVHSHFSTEPHDELISQYGPGRPQ
jgi:ketosteroid isomerase-like protein